VTEWRSPASQDLVRTQPLRRLAQPFRERDFTYADYAAFLDRVRASAARVVPLRAFRNAPRDAPLLGLRHDVDLRLDHALRFAELEHERELRATYFVLHTAPYWRDPQLLDGLLRLQALGHEVGWHNDLVSVALVDGVDPAAYLREQLASLRSAGVDIVGTAAHGSVWCHLLGFQNNAFFTDFPEAQAPRGWTPRAALADFGFEYEAYHLDVDRSYSDSTFDERGRRWHPRYVDFDALRPNESAIVLTHPCNWDRWAAEKILQLPGRLFRKWGELRLRRRVLARYGR
jgi:hypothetical protein